MVKSGSMILVKEDRTEVSLFRISKKFLRIYINICLKIVKFWGYLQKKLGQHK